MVEAAFNPRSVNLGRLGTGESVTKTVELVARDPSKVKLTTIEIVSVMEGLTAKVVKVGDRSAVEVTFEASKVGSIRGRLKVGTTSAKRPTLDLTVRGTVLGNWELLPRSISFPQPVDGEDTLRRTVRIKARKQTSFRVTKAVDTSNAVNTKITKVGDGFSIELTLTKVPEKRRGVIQISTNDPQEPMLKARYFVRAKRRNLPRRPIEAIKRQARPIKRVTPPNER